MIFGFSSVSSSIKSGNAVFIFSNTSINTASDEVQIRHALKVQKSITKQLKHEQGFQGGLTNEEIVLESIQMM